MSDARSVRPPSQARSQATMERFVRATRELLQERSFEEITVADIVSRAERTVGSFYARFEDKHAVLRLLVDQLDARVRDLVHAFCDPVRWDGAPVEEFVAESVKLNVHAYRRSGALFRASLTTAVSDAEFRERRRITMLFGAEAQKKFLLTRRDELGCPDVARASDTMFEMMVATLDHGLLYGPITLTAPNTEGSLITDLTSRAHVILGVRGEVAVDDRAGGATNLGDAGSVTTVVS